MTNVKPEVKISSFYGASKKATEKKYLTPLDRKNIREKLESLDIKKSTFHQLSDKENLQNNKNVSRTRGNETPHKANLKPRKSVDYYSSRDSKSLEKENCLRTGKGVLNSGTSGACVVSRRKSSQKNNTKACAKSLCMSRSPTINWAPSSLGKRYLLPSTSNRALALPPKQLKLAAKDSLHEVLGNKTACKNALVESEIYLNSISANRKALVSYNISHADDKTGAARTTCGEASSVRHISNNTKSLLTEKGNQSNSTKFIKEAPCHSLREPLCVDLDNSELNIAKDPEVSSTDKGSPKSNYFPIFNAKGSPKQNSSLLSSLKPANSPSSSSSASSSFSISPQNLHLSLPGTPKTRKCDTSKESPKTKQMIIDAGQKKFGPIQCNICGMVYTVNHPYDQQQHAIYHKRFLSLLKFTGWKRERMVASFMDGRILKIFPNDPKYAMKKVDEIQSIIDTDLGFNVESSAENRSTKVTYLYVSENNQIVGCLIAESISYAYRLLPCEASEMAAMACSSNAERVACGISRLWTYLPYRHRGIATRLLDALRSTYTLGLLLECDQIAFSDPTMDGRKFASKYCKTKQFLTYNKLVR
ncbi:N-acetyltransferase ESCO1-like [Clavelina lepadiformis]|uniref:N-acetyltransferase ESCO2 n=1 Tax=Clavelina lepadiformis TaxID=159417 RepID=A0ABP0GLN9_CLALP